MKRTILRGELAAMLLAAAVTVSGSPVDPASLPCHLDRAPYVSPRIIQDLSAWESDQGDQMLAVDLAGSQDSNRYSGKVDVTRAQGSRDFVSVTTDPAEKGDDSTVFGYQFIGQTKSGVYVLFTQSSDGGSGVFRNLMLVHFEGTRSPRVDEKSGEVRWGQERVVLEKLGEIPLGDRWDGELKMEGDTLFIGKQGRMKINLPKGNN